MTWRGETEFKKEAFDVLVVMPPGSIVIYAATTAPQGWLKCDGAAVSRKEFVQLFRAIGTVFGTGDGSTTFNLPDFTTIGNWATSCIYLVKT